MADLLKECRWCGKNRANDGLPNAFVWSKMEAESGQDIQTIVRRKEMERLNGGGVFFWGIGTKINTERLLARSPKPEVIFSLMKSKAKKIDSSPKAVLIWTHFVDETKLLRPLPAHALVISNGHTQGDFAKTRYQALVCHSHISLFTEHSEYVDFSHLRNLDGERGRLGFSQVTSTVEHDPEGSSERMYDISMRAHLQAPYCAKLSGAKPVSDEEREQMKALANDTNLTPQQWGEFVAGMRTRYDTL